MSAINRLLELALREVENAKASTEDPSSTSGVGSADASQVTETEPEPIPAPEMETTLSKAEAHPKPDDRGGPEETAADVNVIQLAAELETSALDELLPAGLLAEIEGLRSLPVTYLTYPREEEGGLRILIIEVSCAFAVCWATPDYFTKDNVLNGQVLRKRLVKAAHTVVWAMDGRLAVDLIVKKDTDNGVPVAKIDFDFDLILTDLQ